MLNRQRSQLRHRPPAYGDSSGWTWWRKSSFGHNGSLISAEVCQLNPTPTPLNDIFKSLFMTDAEWKYSDQAS